MVKTVGGRCFLFGNDSSHRLSNQSCGQGTLYHTVQFQFLRSGSKTKPNHVSLQIGVINYSWHVDLDEDWEAVRAGAHTSILSAISCLFV